MVPIVDEVIEVEVPFQEFLDRPEDSPWSEYAHGRAIVSPTPNGRHGQILANLLMLLHPLAPADHITLMAPLDWLLWPEPDGRVRQPDVLIIPRTFLVDGGNRVMEPPILAIEVISRWSRRRDLVVKPAEYARAGCVDTWVIDPADPAQLVVHVFDGRSGEPREVATVTGDDLVAVTTPFPVSFRPSDLVR